jgi:hypothetical protein
METAFGSDTTERMLEEADRAQTASAPRGGGGGGGGLFGTGGSPSTSNRRRYTHEVLPVGEEVYVFGGTEIRPEAAGSNEERLKLGVDSGTGQFIVSDRDESGIAKHYTRRGPLYTLVGVVVSAACL